MKSSIAEKKPIQLVIPFGGYKHYWNVSHPEPDWAELFNFRNLMEIVAPILIAYEPGVVVEYISEDVILRRMNNYTQESLDTYSNVFSAILKWYDKQTPDNLQFRFFRVKDRVNSEALVTTVESMIPERRKLFNSLTPEQQEIELKRSSRSMMWDGDIDLTKFTDEERHERIIESRIIELAYYEVEGREQFLGGYLFEDNHICVCFSFGKSHDNDMFEDLTVASTYGSVVDHWIGRGVLFKQDDTFMPAIVSKQQYNNLKKVLQVKVNPLVPFKNFKEIDVIDWTLAIFGF